MTANTPQPHTRPYILIVDDDDGLLRTLTARLEAEGWQAIGMRNPVAAWTFLKHVHQLPSLMLLDLWMPEMRGDEFLIYQHADGELDRIPVVLMSASANFQRLPQPLEVVALLSKPIDIPRLLELCTRYVPRTNSRS